VVVYWVRNTANEKLYIGQTSTTLERRWYMHTWDENSNSLLHKAIEKHGKEKFSIEVIHECVSKEEMDFVETFYISFLNTKAPYGYNLTDGGEGTLGRPCSDETRKKLSLANKGKPPCARLLDQNGSKNHMFGKTISAEQKEAIRVASKHNKYCLGSKHHITPHTEETKKTLSSKTKKLWEDPAYRQHMSDIHKKKV